MTPAPLRTQTGGAAGAPRIADLRRVASVAFVKRLVAGIGAHHLQAYAAGLAYGAIFSLLPILALVVLLLGVFGAVDLVDRAVDELRPILPADALSLVDTQLSSIASNKGSGGFGVGAVVSALTALWGASGAMRRVMEALTVVHDAEETRPFVRKTLTSVVLAIGAIAFVVVSLVVIVVGGSVANTVFGIIGLGADAAALWNWVRWPALLVFTWLAIALLYRVAPAARQAGGIATPGTVVATLGWIAFSGAFSWYVSSLGSFSASWGAVAGVVVLLLYVQYAGLILLVGALVDVLLFDEERPASRVRRFLRMPASK